MKRFAAVFLFVAVAGSQAAAFPRQHVEDSAPAMRQFAATVDAYIQLHRRLELRVPPLRVTEHPKEILDSSNAMAEAIREVRFSAKEGDIFTAAAATIIRERISDALGARGFRPEQIIAASEAEAEAEENAPQPVVNGRFPWMRGAAMWPCVLNALPPLPDELQYRLVGRDLVLVDLHADLVVDVLRDAIR